ncbi:amidophosphoribosyltransferase [Candidatus Peregrinibacteria bacterium]|nr:amidophosphoribosyltransferase [Candidatus Peregrinibacteria bacterium]
MCGIIGVIGNNEVAQELYDGLVVLQHRGQDAAGMAIYDGDRFNIKKGNGYVRDVFRTKNMVRLKGNIGIGHVRYPTAGSYDPNESQPFYVNSPFGIALIHNGNLTNYIELKEEVLKDNIRHLNTTSDSEVLLNVVANEILHLHKTKLVPEDIFTAMKKVYQRLKGSFSCIMLIAGYGIAAFRDPNGIRPLLFGKRENGSLRTEYIFASENVALSTLDFELASDVQPGEVIYIDMKHNVHRKVCAKPAQRAICIFEYVYLARPDSILDGVSVYKTRLRMGKFLAKQIKKSGVKIDTVMPIPDSARSCALSIAEELGVPYREGLVKNRYIGRTFIMPGQEIRKKSIKYKLNPIELEIRGKSVLLVDDSIVRGNTSKKIVDMVRECEPKKVYFVSSAPPLRWPCLYGVDMPNKKEFIAHNLSIKEIAKVIGVDGLFYQKIEDLVESAAEGNPKMAFCTACFNGKYPTKEITRKMLERAEASRERYRKYDEIEEYDSKLLEDQLSLL